MQLSFWVVHETLNAGGVKSRAEVMSHFVKVARRLSVLGNYHSQFAIVSSLLSAPIYRYCYFGLLNIYTYNYHSQFAIVSSLLSAPIYR